jgi:hypothetical protein
MVVYLKKQGLACFLYKYYGTDMVILSQYFNLYHNTRSHLFCAFSTDECSRDSKTRPKYDVFFQDLFITIFITILYKYLYSRAFFKISGNTIYE